MSSLRTETLRSRGSAGAPLLERPRERLARHGTAALSAAELLALVLRTGGPGRTASALAQRLLERFGSLEGLLRAGDAELLQVAGLGPAKLASLRAALELGARLARSELSPGTRLARPDQAYRHLAPRLRPLRQELFLALLLDSRQRLIGEVEVSRGSLNQSLVHPREVFAPALRESAAAILVAHNHPSGDAEPSPEDHEVTRRLVRAGELLGVRVVDHLVIGGSGFTSFADRGWLDPGPGPGARHGPPRR
jgi:DNA repair protein RadC